MDAEAPCTMFELLGQFSCSSVQVSRASDLSTDSHQTQRSASHRWLRRNISHNNQNRHVSGLGACDWLLSHVYLGAHRTQLVLVYNVLMFLSSLPPAGQHLHSGLWRRLPRNHSGSSLRFHLHRFWNHPERSAHIHPLQQVLRLLLQAQVQPVHSLPEETREGQVCQEDRKKAQPPLWRPPLTCTLISSATFQKKVTCFTAELCKYDLMEPPPHPSWASW